MRFAAVLALLMIYVLLGCSGRPSPALVEREIALRAPELLGSAEGYRTEVRGLADGRVDAIRIIGLGVRPDPHLTVDPLVLTLEQVRYQAQPFHVANIGAIHFEGRIADAAVNHYLRQQGRTASGYLKNVRVYFQRGAVRVTATATVLPLEVPIEAVGRVKIVDGMRVHYEVDTLRVSGVGVPNAVQSVLTNLLNPLVDLSGLRFTPHATRVTIEPGAMVVTGRATLRNLP